MLTFRKHIDPSIDRLDEMLSFKDLQISDELQREEYPYLENITTLLGGQVKLLIKRLHALEDQLEKQILVIERESGDDKKDAVKVYNQILKNISDQVERVNKELATIRSPYFGKIIFNRERSPKLPATTITSYIGKFSYFDKETNKTLITDWRAPIANLYYTNSGPTQSVEFLSPAGQQKGELAQKRQFEISNARFGSIYDAKSGNVAADEFLLSQLNKRLGKKLSDIVSTIQEQQNSIIRDGLGKASILQGVAGSGKTTIVLHRLAYLLFAFEKNINPEKSLIIAPNKMFLDYISDVLPSLGVYGVESNTYIFWAKKVLSWDESHSISPTELLSSKEVKGSMEFLYLLKDFLNEYEDELLRDLKHPNRAAVERRYLELKEKYPQIALEERMLLSIERATLEEKLNRTHVGSYFSEESDTAISKEVRDYLKKMLSPLEIYRRFFESDSTNIPYDVAKYTKGMLKKKKGVLHYATEDLAPLVYILFWLKGSKEFERDYVIADEAQDMSPMQILTLSMISKGSNLMLAGDLAQSIIPPFYINDWKKLISFISAEVKGFSANLYELNKCYRTTVEIVEYANKILKKRFEGSYKLPEAVLRHGEQVKTLETAKEISNATNSDLEALISDVLVQFDKGFSTVALLAKDEAHATKVFERLSKIDSISRRLINSDESEYTSGVLILPINKAKGLEFDAVYILDFNGSNYSDNELNYRLLYVAMTRALHKLTIVSDMSSIKSELLENV